MLLLWPLPAPTWRGPAALPCRRAGWLRLVGLPEPSAAGPSAWQLATASCACGTGAGLSGQCRGHAAVGRGAAEGRVVGGGGPAHGGRLPGGYSGWRRWVARPPRRAAPCCTHRCRSPPHGMPVVVAEHPLAGACLSTTPGQPPYSGSVAAPLYGHGTSPCRAQPGCCATAACCHAWRASARPLAASTATRAAARRPTRAVAVPPCGSCGSRTHHPAAAAGWVDLLPQLRLRAPWPPGAALRVAGRPGYLPAGTGGRVRPPCSPPVREAGCCS